ncbi:diguanylate cyclase [Halomonas sp. M20]|uniref:diguanylate cyclase n=1 Tax=Halomonas sp. M20 TaxID=2763264 RepID=UPI001D0BC0EC|nr:diguanylate cyclase [Halomonas sp. M20]
MRQKSNQRLLQLRQEYGVWLKEEIASLRESAHCDRSSNAWADIRLRLHRLAGAAGTFGFGEVGTACRTLERQLEEALVSRDASSFEAVATSLQALSSPAGIELSPTGAEAVQGRGIAAVSHLKPHKLGHHVVYILEEDKALSQQLCHALSGLDYRIQKFAAQESLEQACEQQCPDALVLPLHLAGASTTDKPADNMADGVAIGEAIQQRMGTSIPLFLTDVSSDFELQLRAVRAEVEGFFTLPRDKMRLVESLDNRLRPDRLASLRIMMVDDDEALLDHYQSVLENAGFSVMTLARPKEVLSAMERFVPDILVLDVRMPQCKGPELAQMVRYHPRWLQVSIVYLSAGGDVDAQLSAMTKAGDDFLVKPIAANVLVASIAACARRARALAGALARDGLTGLLKHADIKERLASSLAQARRRRLPLCGVMLDIDFFKRVNDTHGHLAGDEVIRVLADLLRHRLRETDLIGRYGGEEFLIVLHDTTSAQTVKIIDGLREDFSKLGFDANGTSFSCTFSAGVMEADSVHDTDGLIKAADRCLYQAKNEGRNRVVTDLACWDQGETAMNQNAHA